MFKYANNLNNTHNIDEYFPVQDNGSPPQAVSVVLTINVQDILDPPPTFSQSIYNVQLNEGTYSNVYE